MPHCPAKVRSAFGALSAADAPTVSKAFNTCTPVAPNRRDLIVSWIVGDLTGHLAAMAESAYPLSNSPIPIACSTL